MKTIFPILFLACVSGFTFSQSPGNPEDPILNLKEGVLVVRLRTQSNKVDKLKEWMAKESPGTPVYQKLETQLAETIAGIERENKLVREAFGSLYNYSEVLFFFDTLAPVLRNGKTSGIFLNERMEVDPQLSLGDRFYMVAGIGTTPSSEGASSQEQLIIYDRNFNFMTKPFPGYSRRFGLRAFFKVFLMTGAKATEYMIQDNVEWFNRKFFRYSGRVQKRNER